MIHRVAPYVLSPSVVARYFFHECERHLRYHAVPRTERRAAGVPFSAHEHRPVTAALLEQGYRWEEQVVGTLLLGKVRVAPRPGRLRDRTHSVAETLAILQQLQPGEAIYQPTLAVPAAFYERYGIDPQLVTFPPCRPDLILRVPQGEDDRESTLLRIIDVKASDRLKASHRIQASLYALMLRDILAAGPSSPLRVDLDQAGIWLSGATWPSLFPAALSSSVLEDLLRNRLQRLLASPAQDAPWHLVPRCESCEFYEGCREESERIRSVSLLPNLSIGARQHLREAPWSGGAAPIHTLPELWALLTSAQADAALSTCGSLRGRAESLRKQVSALSGDEVLTQDGSSAALPIREDVRLVLTVQSEPISGRIYAAGFRRLMGKEVFGDGAQTRIFIAARTGELAAVRHDFLNALHDELIALHLFNESRPWREQKSLQSYVFDGYELALFERLLLEATQEQEVADIARALLFHFQNTSLLKQDEHPRSEVPYPIIVLTRIIDRLLALPVPVTLRLQEVSVALPAPRFASTYRARDHYSFELSNRLRSDAIYSLWQRPDALALASLAEELRQRLLAAGAIVDGLRQRVQDQLFAWPPKFLFPATQPFRHVVLSRLAFMCRYESFLLAQRVRETRARSLPLRLLGGISVNLRYLGEDRFEVVGELDAGLLGTSGSVPDRLLAPATEAGEREQLGYSDYRYRAAHFAPGGSLRLASVRAVDTDPASGTVRQVRLEVRSARSQAPLTPGEELRLHPRFTDFTSDRVEKRLRELDQAQDSDFVTLLRDPQAFDAAFPAALTPPALLAHAEAAAQVCGLQPSQRLAFAHLLRRRLTLIWGPPGTGKTHFLATALLCLAAVHHRGARPLRVVITAFTHAAVENLLAQVREVLALLGPALGVPELLLGKIGVPCTPTGAQLVALDTLTVARSGTAACIVGGTVYALSKVLKQGASPFDVLVVDEASQLRLGELALAAAALAPGGRLVLAGDDLQLPPVIQGVYPEATAEGGGLAMQAIDDPLCGLEGSAFAYLRARDRKEAPYTCKLLENWRMNATLNRFPAESLYGLAYLPANAAIAARQLQLAPEAGPAASAVDPTGWLLDPAWPLTVAILEDAHAAAESCLEATLVARLTLALRRRMLFATGGTGERPLPDTEAGDAEFFRRGLFIVSPHHAQIRAIRREIERRHRFHSAPFIGTVDKMQGQQCEVVLVSYGVSNRETALLEGSFIYSKNRLNVAITRARSKCIVFLARPLLEPSFAVLQDERAAEGLAYMHALLAFCREHGQAQGFRVRSTQRGDLGAMTALRCRYP